MENTGVAIDFAENGVEALTMFTDTPDKYDLLLMDIHMPKMDGYQATRKIRSLDHARAKDVPIIAMTANVFKEDIEMCKKVGMNDHIGKPIDTDELITNLNKYLHTDNIAKKDNSCTNTAIRQDSMPAAYNSIDFANRPPSEAASDYPEFLPFIDVKTGLGRLMNNKNLYFMLLKNFTGSKTAAELITAVQEGNFAQMSHTAHTLKGVSANLGLTYLSDIAATIEKRAKNMTDAGDLVSSLAKAIDATMISINRLLESEGIQ